MSGYLHQKKLFKLFNLQELCFYEKKKNSVLRDDDMYCFVSSVLRYFLQKCASVFSLLLFLWTVQNYKEKKEYQFLKLESENGMQFP